MPAYAANNWNVIGLPIPQIDGSGYEVPMQHEVIEEIDTQAQRLYRWLHRGPTVDISVIMTTAQVALFQQFYHATVDEGTWWFHITLAMGGAQRVAVAHFVNGFSIEQITQPMQHGAYFRPIYWRVNTTLVLDVADREQPPWI